MIRTGRRLSLQAIPEVYRRPTRDLWGRILRRYPRTAALIVIGSVATGTWEEDSDIDIVWVTRGRLGRHYGIPLRKNLKGFWKLRVGDYRVVFTPASLQLSSVRRPRRTQAPLPPAGPSLVAS